MTIGIVLWGILTGAFLLLELLGFIDDNDDLPTASQLVKLWKRRGRVERLTLTVALGAVGPLLYAHWVAEWF